MFPTLTSHPASTYSVLVKDLFSLPLQHLPGQSFVPGNSMPGCHPLCSPCWQPERNPTASTMTLSKLQGSSTLGHLEEVPAATGQREAARAVLYLSCRCSSWIRLDILRAPPQPPLPGQTPQPEVTDAVLAAPRKDPSCWQGDSTWTLHLRSNEPEHTSVCALPSFVQL